MAKDFIEFFEPIQELEVSETDLYSLIKEAHSLIETKNFNSVPNTLRKFYECLLYRCKDELRGFDFVYQEDRQSDIINVYKSSSKLFNDKKDFYKNVIKPFLDWTNSGSHCSGANYAARKKTEVYKNIGHVIDIWNWYAKNVRRLDNKYLILEKYSLPDSIMDEYLNLRMKLESKEQKVQQLKEELETLKLEEQETIIDQAELEQDILTSVKKFNEEKLYCTHRTIALFLLGDRIPQTDFANLTESELFGKYSKNKFSEFEYDTALQQLILKEEIIQSGVYFNIFDKNANNFIKFLNKLKMKWNVIKINKTEFRSKINPNNIKIIQKAISENKNVKLEYYKVIANTYKTEKTIRILTPISMVPKDKKSEVYNSEQKYAEDLYYLGAIDNKDGKQKTFRLDGIRKPKII